MHRIVVLCLVHNDLSDIRIKIGAKQTKVQIKQRHCILIGKVRGRISDTLLCKGEDFIHLLWKRKSFCHAKEKVTVAKELLKQLQQEEKESKRNRRDAYEGLRAQFMLEVKNRLLPVVDDVKAFRDWVEKEAAAFRAVMREYGQLRKDEQASFTIVDGDMKLEVRSNKVKSFDERADLAAERLVDYLKRYAMGRELGTDDPMYQLGMTMIERNRQGDLDYKSVSKLYELEDRFDSEYTEIMDLFRESNVVYKTAVNYYFHKRDENGVWHRIEPSFCRL